MQGYVKRDEVLRLLATTMPVTVTYDDPMAPGRPITFEREDMLALLAYGDDATSDSQWVASMYAECSRFEKAASLEAEIADSSYVRWKAQRAAEFRDKSSAKTAKGAPKAATIAEVEEFYRNHADYIALSTAPARLRAQAGVFKGLVESFAIKSRMLDAAVRNMRGYEGTSRTESYGTSARDSALADMQRDALASSSAIEAANALASSQPAVVGPPPPAPPDMSRKPRLES